jgi:hypothetical protein
MFSDVEDVMYDTDMSVPLSYRTPGGVSAAHGGVAAPRRWARGRQAAACDLVCRAVLGASLSVPLAVLALRECALAPGERATGHADSWGLALEFPHTFGGWVLLFAAWSVLAAAVSCGCGVGALGGCMLDEAPARRAGGVQIQEPAAPPRQELGCCFYPYVVWRAVVLVGALVWTAFGGAFFFLPKLRNADDASACSARVRRAAVAEFWIWTVWFLLFALGACGLWLRARARARKLLPCTCTCPGVRTAGSGTGTGGGAGGAGGGDGLAPMVVAGLASSGAGSVSSSGHSRPTVGSKSVRRAADGAIAVSWDEIAVAVFEAAFELPVRLPSLGRGAFGGVSRDSLSDDLTDVDGTGTDSVGFSSVGGAPHDAHDAHDVVDDDERPLIHAASHGSGSGSGSGSGGRRGGNDWMRALHSSHVDIPPKPPSRKSKQRNLSDSNSNPNSVDTDPSLDRRSIPPRDRSEDALPASHISHGVSLIRFPDH